MVDPTRQSASELAAAIRDGRVSPVEVIDATFERIARLNPEFNAFVYLREEEARAEAAEAERALADGDPDGPLHGVPVALKDLGTHLEGMPHTLGGAAPIGELMPQETSIIVERLRDAGAIVVGSTNSPEFGASGDTTNAMFGSTGNPFGVSKTVGGSSGGSTAAVASHMVPLALGSDLAGSLRVPASTTNNLGLKPTPGLVPFCAQPDLFRGIAPWVSKGGITRTVEDTALLLEVIGGFHPRDPLSVPGGSFDYGSDVADYEIAYSPDFGVFEVEEVVHERVETAVDALRDAGASVDRVEVAFERSLAELIQGYNTLVNPSLASTFENVKRDMDIDLMADHRDELPPHLPEFVEDGHTYSAVEYRQANLVRSHAYNVVQDVLDAYDLLVTPTMAVPPFEKGQREPPTIDGEPLASDKEWFLTWPLNLTGHPAASVPAGTTEEGLPVGAQLIGTRFDEATILAASAALEREQPWAGAYPAR